MAAELRRLPSRLDFGDARPKEELLDMGGQMTTVLDVTLPCTLEVFVDTFLSDNCKYPAKKFCEDMKCWDVESSRWRALDSDSKEPPRGNFIRSLKFMRKLGDYPIGPQETRVHKLQRYNYEDNELNLETVTCSPDVPFGGNFHVRDHWQVVEEDGECHMTIGVTVAFEAKLPFSFRPFKGTVSSETVKETKAEWQTWMKLAPPFINRIEEEEEPVADSPDEGESGDKAVHESASEKTKENVQDDRRKEIQEESPSDEHEEETCVSTEVAAVSEEILENSRMKASGGDANIFVRISRSSFFELVPTDQIALFICLVMCIVPLWLFPNHMQSFLLVVLVLAQIHNKIENLEQGRIYVKTLDSLREAMAKLNENQIKMMSTALDVAQAAKETTEVSSMMETMEQLHRDDKLEDIAEEQQQQQSNGPEEKNKGMAERVSSTTADGELNAMLMAERSKQAWDLMWKLAQRSAAQAGWSKEKVEGSITLYSRPKMHGSERVRMFRSEGIVEGCSPKQLFDFLCNLEVAPKWNTSIMAIDSIKQIDDDTDITKVVTRAVGPVSAREFVNTRKRAYIHDKIGEAYMIAGQMATSFSDEDIGAIAPSTALMRGEYGPGGYAVHFVKDRPDCAFLVWIVDVMMHGYIPRWVVERGVMSEGTYFIALVRSTIGAARKQAQIKKRRPRRSLKTKPSVKKQQSQMLPPAATIDEEVVATPQDPATEPEPQSFEPAPAPEPETETGSLVEKKQQ